MSGMAPDFPTSRSVLDLSYLRVRRVAENIFVSLLLSIPPLPATRSHPPCARYHANTFDSRRILARTAFRRLSARVRSPLCQFAVEDGCAMRYTPCTARVMRFFRRWLYAAVPAASGRCDPFNARSFAAAHQGVRRRVRLTRASSVPALAWCGGGSAAGSSFRFFPSFRRFYPLFRSRVHER
ncbi:hypothetical protein BKA93DRAFT_146347 [Sparassis latifolia]